MNILESFQSALQSVKANKLRSFLTMLGIIIGISSVITIVSIGDAAKNFITGEFADIGTNLIKVNIKNSNGEIEKKDYFTQEDIQIIRDKVPEVTLIMGECYGMGSLKIENKFRKVQIIATNQDNFKAYKMKMLKGRYLTEHDVDARKPVAIIDEPTAKKLFRSTDIIGEKIKINSGDKYLDVTIVGVSQNPNDKMSGFGDDDIGMVTLPVTISDRILKNTDIRELTVILSDMNHADEVNTKIVKILENKHQVKEKYFTENGFKGLDSVNKVLGTITTVLGAIAAISLLVGGIGVMNIMLVSVTERTREIGIRKAIGAKTRDIKMQFLMESIILCLIGGTIGTILGISFGKIGSLIVHVDVPVSIKVIFISFAFSSAVGIFFGLYPANKAAKLDPIEALRYE